MKKILLKIPKLILAILFLPFWWLQRLIPRNKNIFVFGSWRGRKYSDNSKALYEYILKNEPNIRPYWITRDKKLYKKLLSENKPVVLAFSFKGWLVSLCASVAFNCATYNNVNQYALNGAIRIWLFHGMPLKKIGGDIDNSIYNLKRKHTFIELIKLLMIKYLLPYDYLKKIVSATISSGELFLPFLKSAFFLSENRVWATGLPRTDFYFENKTEGIINKIRKNFIDSRIVLYMPTFRDSLKRKGMPYNPFDDKSFNSILFLDFLNNTNIVFLYKAHHVDSKFNCSILSDRFTLINDNDYDELYVLISNIDILITDYSSVYFDFLCLDKPAVLAPFDYEDYINKSRNLNFDYNLLPSIKAYSWNELIEIIAEKKYYSVPKEEREKFCKYNDGHASERVLQKTLELINNN